MATSADACVAQRDLVTVEKPGFDHVEESLHEVKLSDGIEDFQIIPRLDRRVLLKLDLLLMPTMCIIFVFLFLDRANIGNARVAGMQKSLHLTDLQYQTGMLNGQPFCILEANKTYSTHCHLRALHPRRDPVQPRAEEDWPSIYAPRPMLLVGPGLLVPSIHAQLCWYHCMSILLGFV